MRPLIGPALALATLASATHAYAQGTPPDPPPPPPPPVGPYAAPPPSPPPHPYGAWGPPPAGGPLPGWASERPTQKVTRWYGWQTLIGVIASDIITLVGQGSAVSYFGVAGHVLTGPIVHWAHGHTGKGFASLGLNVGAPFLGGLLGVAAGSAGNEYSALGFGLIGAGIGYIAAPIVDIAVLSTETTEKSVATAKGARALLPTSVAVVPMVNPNRIGLSLVGQF